MQTSNQFPHQFCPHHSSGFTSNPYRAACVKLSELCFRPELLDANSIESATHENRDLGRRRLLVDLQPLRSRFPRPATTTGKNPVDLA
jgi:hypothetical protein